MDANGMQTGCKWMQTLCRCGQTRDLMFYRVWLIGEPRACDFQVLEIKLIGSWCLTPKLSFSPPTHTPIHSLDFHEFETLKQVQVCKTLIFNDIFKNMDATGMQTGCKLCVVAT
jgi:hypothetical protein